MKAKYQNPFFKKKRSVIGASKSKVHRKMKLIIFEVLIVGVALICFFYFSAVFQVVGVETRGFERLDEREVVDLVLRQASEKRYALVPAGNMFFFDSDEFKNKLNKKYFFNQMEITRKMPGTIIVSVDEKDYAAIWQEGESAYFISREGDIMALVNSGDENGNGGEVVDNSEAVDNLLSIDNFGENKVNDNFLENQEGRIGILFYIADQVNNCGSSDGLCSKEFLLARGFAIDDNGRLDILTRQCAVSSDDFSEVKNCKNGPVVYFGSSSDIDNQISKLKAVIKEKLRDSVVAKEYIDLRYQDRVYYK